MPNNFLTPLEYLAIERGAEFKSEYVSGEMFAMSGASREHSLIVGNLVTQLNNQLDGRPCETYSNDMRVRVTPTAYTYPDVVVACGKMRFEDDYVDTLVNPSVIFAVLSKSTENWDRGGKFEYSRRVESLTDYILVSQFEYLVEHRTRQSTGTWLLTEVEGPDAVLTITSIGCTISLADIYKRVVFSESGR